MPAPTPLETDKRLQHKFVPPPRKPVDRSKEIKLPEAAVAALKDVNPELEHKLQKLQGKTVKGFGKNLSDEEMQLVCYYARNRQQKMKERVQDRHNLYFQVSAEYAASRRLKEDAVRSINGPLPTLVPHQAKKAPGLEGGRQRRPTTQGRNTTSAVTNLTNTLSLPSTHSSSGTHHHHRRHHHSDSTR